VAEPAARANDCGCHVLCCPSSLRYDVARRTAHASHSRGSPLTLGEKMQVCEKCGATDFESRWQGLSYEFRCSKCHYGAVTTLFPPIVRDEGSYKIVITSLGSNPNRSLIAINRKFAHGIRRTKELFSSGERELLIGQAHTVWKEAQHLRSAQVPFRIEPAFPYDLETYDPAHGHEHDWRPIDPNA
jgi:hypothetical protein